MTISNMLKKLRFRKIPQATNVPENSPPPNEAEEDTQEQKPCMTSLTDSSSEKLASPAKPATSEDSTDILIAGGGIVGLVLALAIHKYVKVTPEIYEQCDGFEDDVGAGMGLYANGLRVIRDIDPVLLKEIQDGGFPYMYRHYERHDGTSVVKANESVLGSNYVSERDELPPEEKTNDAMDTVSDEAEGLHTMGIRRWKLQQALHKAVKKAGIPIYFDKKFETVENLASGMTEVVFTDCSKRRTKLLVGADGGRSAVRTAMLLKDKSFTKATSQNNKCHRSGDNKMPTVEYTGVTCIMGVAKNRTSRRGISFPVSNTTKCHGAYYPTGESEQCFQIHVPVAPSSPECQDSCWGNLSQKVSQEECGKLAEILQADGWHEEKFLAPLRDVTKAVRVGFCKLTPELKTWSFPNAQGQPRTILVGDAAHPPVPYIGQGCQQGLEDAATLALLLQRFCLDFEGKLDLSNMDHAVSVYESIRIPRVKTVLGNAEFWGDMQQKRAQNPAYNVIKEE